MLTAIQKIKQFFKSEEGVSAIEYALIAALIAAAIIGGVSLLGKNVSTEFSSIAGVV
ncbi:MAG: Flp family type IVb pilin [Betaproteobacteria bacterium]|nr:Flp family type IVb pilin [Betaproteobacteria bacterium]MDE2621868.1 Flp family type IVb pilin [Betaproteobacteria bacterium]